MGTTSAPPVCRERIVSVSPEAVPPFCVLANRNTIRLPTFLAHHVAAGDEIVFPVPEASSTGSEIFVTKDGDGISPSLYLAPIGYVTQPKRDKRGASFVTAEVAGGALGICAVHLPCAALRDYFYRPPAPQPPEKRPGLYELLRVEPRATPAQMWVAFKLRKMELEADGAPPADLVSLERAFNILAQPELRAAYDALLADPETPVVFPYGGFGSLLASGERSHDGATFFVRRILAYRPEQRRRRFHVPLRCCDFYADQALCRDVGRKLEFWLDPAVLHLNWDATWNQWKHLLRVRMEIEGTFVQSGKYRKRKTSWEPVQWETALPSRLAVRLAADAEQQIAAAHATHHRFGQYARALDQVRLLLEHRAVEKTELERICTGLRIPGDLDIAQISWRPDYDAFFYRQLSRRARRLYLFRGEYIFDLDRAVVVETPQLGHATYVFAKPRNMDTFLHLYTRVSKEDIRRNQDNVGEGLGFLKQVIHGSNPRAWFKELRQQLGEKRDFVSALSE